jgi:glycosyltransferase involved in cell wall biosynthesis
MRSLQSVLSQLVKTLRHKGDIYNKTMASSPQHQILIIVDKHGWAQDHKTRNIQKALSNRYTIIKKYQDEVTEADLEQADLIQVYYWMQFSRMAQLESVFKRNVNKLLIGVCSHYELENERHEPALAWLRQARAVFALNQLLYQEVLPQLEVPVFYTPNGVDTGFFVPGSVRQSKGTLRIGWAGSLKNQGPEQRGFNNLIVPAVESVDGCELVTAIREERWRSHEEMVEFYRSLDVYLCASRNDGTPNPCLEAASCGIPIVSTYVGNMPELIKPGVNGYFIEPNVPDIARVLTLLRDKKAHRIQLGQAMRASILAWDWSLLSENYHQMYQFAIAMLTAESFKSLNEERRKKELLK